MLDKAAEDKYGIGSKMQIAAQAISGVFAGLAGGNVGGAVAAGAAPLLAQMVKQVSQDNEPLRILLHTLASGLIAKAQGGSVAGGAAGGLTAGLMGYNDALSKLLFGREPSELSADEKMLIANIVTLAGAATGGAVDGSAGIGSGASAGRTEVENNYLSVSEKTELELAKLKLNSKDPVEREKAQQTVNELREKDITSDQKVIDACGNGNAGSAACAGARLEVIAAKGEYENTGNYNSKASQQYADAYGQIVNLLNITSVDAQNQQQVKDAMVNYFMVTKGVDRKTAEGYAETKQGMDIIVASVTPILGSAAASKLGNISTKANEKSSLLKEMSSQGIKYTPDNIVQVVKNPDGKIVFLETGNNKAGLQHIISEHAKDFANIGVSEAQIPTVVMKAVSEGKIVGYQGKGTGRPIYETVINGEVHRLAITVSSNGFMVGANPAGRVK